MTNKSYQFILVLFSTILSCNLLHSQNKIISYKFEVKNKIYIDSINNKYLGSTQEFNIYREVINDTNFIEFNLFYHDTSIFCHFIIHNHIWYLKNNCEENKLNLFFNFELSKVDTICIGGKHYSVHWNEAGIWRNDNNYIFNLRPLGGGFETGWSTYIFNPIYGIIGMKNNDGVIYLRNDLLEVYKNY
jgi:hypothetical protein